MYPLELSVTLSNWSTLVNSWLIYVEGYVEGKSSLIKQRTTRGITGGSSYGVHRRQNESGIAGELGICVGKCSSTYSSGTVTHLQTTTERRSLECWIYRRDEWNRGIYHLKSGSQIEWSTEWVLNLYTSHSLFGFVRVVQLPFAFSLRRCSTNTIWGTSSGGLLKLMRV